MVLCATSLPLFGAPGEAAGQQLVQLTGYRVEFVRLATNPA